MVVKVIKQKYAEFKRPHSSQELNKKAPESQPVYSCWGLCQSSRARSVLGQLTKQSAESYFNTLTVTCNNIRNNQKNTEPNGDRFSSGFIAGCIILILGRIVEINVSMAVSQRRHHLRTRIVRHCNIQLLKSKWNNLIFTPLIKH